MSADLNELRSEHAAVGVGPLLADLVERVARATAPTYPPGEYSDSASWDRHAIEEACQDWVVNRLVARDDLSRMLATAGTLASLRGMLTRSFQQHLISRRRRSSATNLYQRILKMLQNDARFMDVGGGNAPSSKLWVTSMSGTSDDAAPPNAVERMLKAVNSRSDAELGVVRYGPYSLKSSPILRAPQLAEFLVMTMEAAGGPVSTADLFGVACHRFDLLAPPPEELDEGTPSTAAPLDVRVERDVLARSVQARLGLADAKLVLLFHAREGDAQQAAADGRVSEAEVVRAVDRALEMIAEYAESLEEARAAYEALCESLFLMDEES